MIERKGYAPWQIRDLGECSGTLREHAPGTADTFGYVPGRLVRPEPEPEPLPSMSLGAQRMRAYRERQR